MKYIKSFLAKVQTLFRLGDKKQSYDDKNHSRYGNYNHQETHKMTQMLIEKNRLTLLYKKPKLIIDVPVVEREIIKTEDDKNL